MPFINRAITGTSPSGKLFTVMKEERQDLVVFIELCPTPVSKYSAKKLMASTTVGASGCIPCAAVKVNHRFTAPSYALAVLVAQEANNVSQADMDNCIYPTHIVLRLG